MIDSQARSRLGEAARALVAGRITNDEFENRIPQSDDPAIGEIFDKGFWRLYGDLSEHRLAEVDRLGAEDRKFASRCILFLTTSLPYVWPVPSPRSVILRDIINLITLGASGRAAQRRLLASGDQNVWPFHSLTEYKDALSSPPYLHGLSPNNSFNPMPLRGTG